ncbi:Calx-beta domain-containing protein,putative calcium-binding protein [Xenococcus sp. PCC 7305]|uniref:Calx-beta domain-containing protein n=1 Tax=Xenococcus sp. PCC 7305 TaxID=102125 RepID=UPI0002ACE403|nr:Calx-beta domain-containing protein [Xenococcus sp. PCC 7305]ELS03113.1 Calx-beta domain-containing protein,putative calcium-binding protein [Xenococcus sp. PCC 7305]
MLDESLIESSQVVYTVSESELVYPNLATITLSRSGNLNNSSNIGVFLTGGTAEQGLDYDSFAFPFFVSFQPEQETQIIEFEIFDDYDLEGTEIIELKLQTIPGIPDTFIGTHSTATVEIRDNEVSYFDFAQTVYKGNEDEQAVVTITRTGNLFNFAEVEVFWSDETATEGLDYLNLFAQPQSVSFQPGETTQTIVFDILDDGEYEGTETVNLQLQTFPGIPELALGSNSTATLEILDDDDYFIVTGLEVPHIDGEAGFDILSIDFSQSPSGIIYSSTNSGSGEYSDGVNTMTFANIEAIEAIGSLYDDVFTGLAANDLLSGLDGNDNISGGTGADILYGDNDNDSLYGNDGNDTLSGGNGADVLKGHNNNDSLVGGNGNDTLNGGNGDDILQGNDDNDKLYGSHGNDTLIGGNGADVLKGNNNNDSLVGGNGNDTLNGGNGDDLLQGNDDNDKLYGSDGNDTLIGGLGLDILYGKAGSDYFRLESTTTENKDIIKDFEDGIDFLELGSLDFSALTIAQAGSSTNIIETATMETIATVKGIDATNIDINDFI